MRRTAGPVTIGTFALALASPALGQDVDARIRMLERQMEEMRRAFDAQIAAMQGEIAALRAQTPTGPGPEQLPSPPGATREEGYEQAARETTTATEPVVSSSQPRVKLSLSGQVNRAINLADDGDETKAYFVDNDTSNSRLRFLGIAEATDDLRFGAQFELAFSPNNSSDVSQDEEDTGDDALDNRRVELAADSRRLGRVWLGKGSGAADGTAEYDLSGTDVIMYSGVADIVGGLFFTDGGAPSDVTVADAFFNLDSGRYDRVRYDTPALGPGIQASASYGEDQRWDLALTWGGDFGNWTGVEVGDFSTLAALGLYDPSDGEADLVVIGSASVLHNPTGLSLTGSAGRQDGGSDPTNLYAKLGWQHAFFDVGDTRFGVDFTRGTDLPDDGDEGYSVGGAVVQAFSEFGAELYGQLRWFTLDSDEDLDDITVGTLGTRVKF